MSARTPYFRQRNGYSCGPASLQMIAAGFGIRRSQQKLARLLETTGAEGTSRADLVRGCRRLGLRAEAHADATMAELRSALRNGARVIVNYREPEADIGHFAVVARITARDIILDDPWHGPSFRITLKEFSRRWHGKHRRTHKRWMLVAAPVSPKVSRRTAR